MVFTIYGHGWPSWSCDQDPANELSFHLPIDAPHKIWLSSAKRFQGRSLKLWTTDGRTDGRRTDGRRTDWYTISSPCEPSAQVSLQVLWGVNVCCLKTQHGAPCRDRTQDISKFNSRERKRLYRGCCVLMSG